MSQLYQLIKTDSPQSVPPSQTIAAVLATLQYIQHDLRDIDHKAKNQRPKTQFVKAAGGCAYVSANRLRDVCIDLSTITFPDAVDLTDDMPQTNQFDQAIELLKRLAIATLNYDTIRYPLKQQLADQAVHWLIKHGHLTRHETPPLSHPTSHA